MLQLIVIHDMNITYIELYYYSLLNTTNAKKTYIQVTSLSVLTRRLGFVFFNNYTIL